MEFSGGRRRLTFQEAVFEIQNRPIMPEREPSLEPIQSALNALSLKYPSDLKKVILIAGTNGKGTVAKTLSHFIHKSGKRIGLYTSPHLVSICERIQINGESVSEFNFSKCYSEIKSLAIQFELSHFEILTLMAAHTFLSGSIVEPTEYAIFEVGMGGTWDATNALPHKTSVITKLGFDHEHLLGRDIVSIAKNKFGIIQDEAQVFSFEYDSDVEHIIECEYKYKTHSWIRVPSVKTEIQKGMPPQYAFYYEGRKYHSPLIGERAVENISLAMRIAESFDIKINQKTLDGLNWPGRMSELKISGFCCPVYLSGDHNIQGIESLVSILKDFEYKKVYFLLGIGIKKNANEIFEALLRVKNSQILLTTASFMGRKKEEYGDCIEKALGYREMPTLGLEFLKDKVEPNDLVVVSGSLYLVGDVLSYFNSGGRGL